MNIPLAAYIILHASAIIILASMVIKRRNDYKRLLKAIKPFPMNPKNWDEKLFRSRVMYVRSSWNFVWMIIAEFVCATLLYLAFR